MFIVRGKSCMKNDKLLLLLLLSMLLLIVVTSRRNKTSGVHIKEITSNCTEESTEKCHYMYIHDSIRDCSPSPATVIDFDVKNGSCFVYDSIIEIDNIYKPIESGFFSYECTDSYVIVYYDGGDGMIYFDIDDEGKLIYNQEKSIENKRISILFPCDKFRLRPLIPSEAIF